MLYMLDTNICSYILKNKPVYMKDKLRAIEENGHKIILSSIVVSELLYGAKKKNSDRLSKLVNDFINNFLVYDFDKKAAKEYATIKTSLESKGTIIGGNDLFIAAHAKSQDMILVTNNTREFQRVDDLVLDNWVE